MARFVEESLSEEGVRSRLLEIMKEKKLFNLDITFLSIIRGFIDYIKSDRMRMDKEKLKEVIVEADDYLSG